MSRFQVDEIDACVLRRLNAKEVARRLGVSPTTVRRWARTGKPGFPKPNSDGLYAEWAVDRFVADSKLRPQICWAPIQ